MFTFVTPRQVQVFVWCLLRLLDKSVQQNHASRLINIEKNSGNAIMGQTRPHFVDAAGERSAHRHSDWPAELDGLDILPDSFPVILWQILQPLPNGFTPEVRLEEDRRDAFAFSFSCSRWGVFGYLVPLAHKAIVPHKVH